MYVAETPGLILNTYFVYVYASAVAAPQLMSVVLTSFRNGMFELSLQYDQQVRRSAAHIGSIGCYHT